MQNRPFKTLVWLLSYISIASVSAAMITPAIPIIERTFALHAGEVEWVVSVFLIGYVLGQLVYGPLANVWGRLKALQWGLNLNLFGLLLCLFAGFEHHYYLLLFGRFITGLGSAAGLVCTFMLINEWLPEAQRKTAMAYAILSFALGIGFAVLLGSLITQYIQWQGCFVFLLLQGVVMRIGTRVFDETLTQPKPFHIYTVIRDYGEALRSLRLVSFSSIMGACASVAYCYAAAAPQIAHEYLHLSVSAYGYWNLINIVGMLAGGLSARELMQRVSVITMIGIGYAGSCLAWLSLVGFLLMNSQSALWFFVSTGVLYCCSGYLSVGGSYLASKAIDDKASAASAMSFINMSIATLTVMAMGYVSPNPLDGFLLILAGVFSITFLLLLLSWP